MRKTDIISLVLIGLVLSSPLYGKEKKKEKDFLRDLKGMVVYSRNDKLFILNPRTGKITKMRDKEGSAIFGKHPYWSPEGRRIIFSQEGKIVTIKLDGTDLRTLVSKKGLKFIWPSWSPDGKRIAFAGYSDNIWNSRLYIASVTNPYPVLTGDIKVLLIGSPPSWSPDSKKIVFSTLGKEIIIFTIKGNKKEKMGKGFCPSFAPGGQEIVFWKTMGHYLFDLGNEQQRRVMHTAVTFLFKKNRPAIWSKNGDYLLVYSYRVFKGDVKFKIIRLEDKKKVKLPKVGKSIEGVSWSKK